MQVEALKMTPVSMHAANYAAEAGTAEKKVTGFGQYLSDALKKTNDLQNEAKKMDMALAAGQIDDISQVVVASEKANVALQLTMQVRNKAVEAYQEIMRMQV